MRWVSAGLSVHAIRNENAGMNIWSDFSDLFVVIISSTMYWFAVSTSVYYALEVTLLTLLHEVWKLTHIYLPLRWEICQSNLMSWSFLTLSLVKVPGSFLHKSCSSTCSLWVDKSHVLVHGWQLIWYWRHRKLSHPNLVAAGRLDLVL